MLSSHGLDVTVQIDKLCQMVKQLLSGRIVQADKVCKEGKQICARGQSESVDFSDVKQC